MPVEQGGDVYKLSKGGKKKLRRALREIRDGKCVVVGNGQDVLVALNGAVATGTDTQQAKHETYGWPQVSVAGGYTAA